MNIDSESVCWLLWKVKRCVAETIRRREAKAPSWGSSRRFIFAGSYDIWETEADGPRYMQIMIDRINEAKKLGLIVNETGNETWRHDENWYLTVAGEEFYEKNKTWD